MPRIARVLWCAFCDASRVPAGMAGEGDFGMIYQTYDASELLAMPLRQIAEKAAYQFS